MELTQQELDRLMATLDHWPYPANAAFVRFALFTGLRRGELFNLTWEDVDFERSTVTLRAPMAGKTRALSLNCQAMDVLRSLDATTGFIFPDKNGKQRADFKGLWQRIRKAAGLPDGLRFHGLRRHFASTFV